MSKYYYLIAGLAELTMDDSKLPVALHEFRSELQEALSVKDCKLMDLLLLENDCRNLMSLLSTGSVPQENATGLFTVEQLEELVAMAGAQERPSAEIPLFMYDYTVEWLGGAFEERRAFAGDALWSRFYEYATHTGNSMVNEWYRLNLNINNIRAAFAARKYGLDTAGLIVGDGDVCHALRTSGARDWGLSQELSYFDEVARLEEEQDLALRERKFDVLRWRWLEENTFFHYFTVERLFAYMVQLSIVERWTTMDREHGQQLFREFIGTLKDQTQVPREFMN